MKKLGLPLLFLFIVLTSNLLYSQPRCILHLYGGFLVPTADLGTNASFIPSSDYYLENNYGMKFGINFLAGDIKLAIDPNCHLRGMMGLSLNVFTNPKEVLTLGLLSVVRTNINIVSFQLGAEYAFSPKNRISPFVGGAFTSNFISGDDFSAQTRYGLRFTVGGDIKIRNNFGAIMGISYDIANLMGKSTNINTLRYDVNQFPLNDEEFTLEGNKISAKTISYLNFYVGFSLFLGNN